MRVVKLESEEQLDNIIQLHNQTGADDENYFVVVDLETTGLNPFKDKIIDIQLSGFTEDEVYTAPGSFSSLLKGLSVRVVGHNLKFDVTFAHRHGVDLTHWKYHDTLLLGHLFDENRESNSLDSWIKQLYDDPYKEEFWKKYDSYETAPEAERHEYGAKDIYYTGKLYRHLIASLASESVPASLLDHVHSLQYSLLKTEIEGIKVDLPYLTDLGSNLKSKIESVKPKMRELVLDWVDLIEMEAWEKEIGKRKTDKAKSGVQRPEFSFDSSKQLINLLYDKLRLPKQVNAKTRNVSVDYDSLEALRGTHPVIGLIQEYRELGKVSGTYIDGTLERLVGERIYPQFNVHGTKGSRISHSNPNLGQLPKSGGIKGIYVPDEGQRFSDHDYGQLEVCIEAHYTQDKALLSIIHDGLSKHDITAQALGIPRDTAKTVNFGMQYHCGPEKVAKIIGCSKADGLYAYNKYWERYAGVKAFKEKVTKMVDAGLPIVDLFGRKRRFEKKYRWEGSKEYRQAYNFIIQSSGGQLMNNAFYKADTLLRGRGTGKGLWTVHDSGLFSHIAEYCEEQANEINAIMVNEGKLIGLTVPLKVDFVANTTRWED